ncbi:tRNA (5-methylaminomethyl-2-thiouridylate)-methyltransferase [Alcanivorax sp. VBW004]|jgi:tRNA U34 2-thiouridine synthase MnmA/TrmU|uniref:tRNA (5-methylaminomethyl-2-thiouridylate)-methyltransferase n=1 Tax=Alcanivorax sp. VBW004 TaxID=1287708 RepID=UPI0012BD4826|nr:tRNA (5-methylaminomethyl-2-thiouridylate)-methyltransferase [Alcanivorax sp. VBW004]MTT51520.1 tRNA (5-methylaminomethyl-2-thiouridylate)-methyltransferase [Alcanivorax sp. VBW004]
MTEASQPIKRRAIALVSGGLDSMLAVKVMQEQGIEVEGVNFYTGFCVEGHTHAIRKKDKDKEKRNNALWVAEQLGIKMHIIDISEEYKDVVLNPKHGYGANLNPCLDCKIFMVNQATLMINKARELAGDRGFDFIVTGEVIGQRPKSQRKETMPIISQESGADDRLLRPLCAQNLPPTLPEREGWVNRDELHDFSGRNRKPQMALAAKFGLDDFAQPAGGCCFLTDESYSNKLADLWKARNERRYELDDIMLLKVGRHLRPQPHYKLIISREEGENRFLEGYRYQFTSITTVSCPGPLALVDGQFGSDAELEQAAAIVARYSKGRVEEAVTLEVRSPDGVAREITVAPAQPDAVLASWNVG